MKLFTVPNIITLGNLLCGCLAIVFAFEGNLVFSAYLVGIAAVLDFLDGFVARALKQYSEIGKQLDSLADMVTFGVVPGIVMFQLIRLALMHAGPASMDWTHTGSFFERNPPLALAAFLIPLFSALRLAKFNIDTRQSDSFIGVPTPANAILICSLALILRVTTESYRVYADSSLNIVTGDIYLQALMNPWVLIGITIIMSVLLISEIPLFALKFKSFGWKGNGIRWSFLAAAVVLLVTLQYVGIPLAIVLYVLMSVGSNIFGKKGTS